MNEGANISREKFTYKLHDLWEFGLKNLMAIRLADQKGAV
jgi:hypothetical protein